MPRDSLRQVKRLCRHVERCEASARAEVARRREQLATMQQARQSAEAAQSQCRHDAEAAEAQFYAQLHGERLDVAGLDAIEGRLIEIDDGIDQATKALARARTREQDAQAAAEDAAARWRQTQRRRDKWSTVAERVGSGRARKDALRAEGELDELAGMAAASMRAAE